MERSILIIGASGFIGSYFTKYLQQNGIDFSAAPRLDLKNSDQVQKLIDSNSYDVVVQLGWTASGTLNYRQSAQNQDWSSFTVALAEQCAKKGVDFIGFGSMVERLSKSEDLYSISKNYAFNKLEDLINCEEISWIRPFFVFDEVLGRPRLISDAEKARKNGGRLIIETPNAQNDFVHVKDVATGCYEVMIKRMKGLVEIGSGETHSALELLKSLNYGPQLEFNSIQNSAIQSNQGIYADIRRLQQNGWEPIYTKEIFNS